MADELYSSRLSPPFCKVVTPVTFLPDERQDLERASLTVLHSNVRSLHQAYDELCKTCSTLHPAFICLTETHLFHDATDTIYPTGYVIAARHDQSLHGGGVIIMIQENLLFDEIDTSTVSLPEVAEIVAIGHHEFLIACCYRQPSSSDLTLFRLFDNLLDTNSSLSPVICGDFNVHEASWLHSSHTSMVGTAALDFCESRGLHQLISFPTRQSAILDLILSERTGTTTPLPNLDTSDNVAIFLSLAVSSHFPTTTPPPRRVFHWKYVPWNKLSRYFHSINWNFQGSTDDVTTQCYLLSHLEVYSITFPQGLATYTLVESFL